MTRQSPKETNKKSRNTREALAVSTSLTRKMKKISAAHFLGVAVHLHKWLVVHANKKNKLPHGVQSVSLAHLPSGER